MEEITTIGLDLAKNIFQAHGSDSDGRVLLRKKLRREQLLPFFAKQPAWRHDTKVMYLSDI